MNGRAGRKADNALPGGAVVVLNGNAVTHNGVAGADTTGGGVIQALQNNGFQFNNANVNGALPPLGAL